VEPGEKDLEVVGSALSEELHATTYEIAAPSGDTEVGGAALSGPTEADSLHHAIDVHPNGTQL